MLHSPENFGFTILNSFELSSPELDCIPPASRPEYFSYSTYEIPSDALQMLLKI